MTKKEPNDNSAMTSGAIALVTSDQSPTTQADFKVSKADMISIISTSLVESLEKELGVYQKELFDINTKIDKELQNIVNIERKLVLKDNIINIQDDEGLTINTKFIGSDTIDGEMHITVSYECSSRHVAFKRSNSLTKVIYRGYETDSYVYRINIPATIKKLREQKEIKSENIKEVKNRLSKANNSKYVNAQLNMGLLAGMANGKQVVDGLNKLITNLKTTIFSKDDTKTLSN